MYYILVCLSKVFQRTIFSFVLPFQRESVCKGKAFFRNLQIFSKFFSKKILEGFQKACGLSFLAPLHIRKVRYSVQHPALSSIASALLSLSSSAALPLESGCKGTDFFLSCNFYTILFCRIFSGSCLTRWFTLCYKAYFFVAIRKRMWNDLHYIIRACAYVCA